MNWPVWDWLGLFGASLGLGLMVWLGERLRSFGVPSRMVRRGVHSGVGLFVAATPFLFSEPDPVYVVATLFVVLNSLAWTCGWWPGIHQVRPNSIGTITMPIALIVGLLITWSVAVDRVVALQIAFLILAVADPLASCLGERWGQYRLVSGATVVGTGAVLGSAGSITVVVLRATTGWASVDILVVSVLVAVATAAAEMIARRGMDNLCIVLAALFVLIPVLETVDVVPRLAVAGVIGGGFGVVAYATRSLTARASVTGGLYAASLVGLGGWAWAVPGFTFFGLSSGLSMMPSGTAGGDSTSTTKGGGRTVAQVLANGGLAWGLLGVFVVIPDSYTAMKGACHAGFLGALAAAAADTWATEIGTRFASSAWSLRTGQPVPVGTSGAVSVIGSMAAVLGAASVAAAAVASGYGESTITPLMWITSAGIVGMFVDSVCGATIQARFRDLKSEAVVESSSDKRTIRGRGWRGVDNNVVNLLGTAAGAITPVFL